MNPIEMRLTGRQTTQAGITRAVNQLLDQGPIARLELRLSTQTTPRVPEEQVRKQLAELLRNHGHALAAVSVRVHPGAMDDASGEHLLRIIPGNHRVTPQAQPTGWRRWLPAWLAPGQQPRPPTPAALATPRVEPGLQTAPQPPARPDPKAVTLAVAKLREAVTKACSLVESADGLEIVGLPDANQPLGRARITVYLPSLHQVLQPLVQQDSAAIAQMLRQGGMALASGFHIDYDHQPTRHGEGTCYANESDVLVRLFLADGAQGGGHDDTTHGSGLRNANSTGTGTAPVLHTLRPDTPALPATSGNRAGSGVGLTAMPDDDTLPEPALTVRVVGTLAQPFARPFELVFDTLPALLDRHALQQAGFGRDHADLLPVASNSCPLRFCQGPDGQVLLQPATWADAHGHQRAMYFDHATRAGLLTELTLQPDGQLLVVNAPAGVRDPASGRLLPALVVQVLPGAGRLADAAQGLAPLARQAA